MNLLSEIDVELELRRRERHRKRRGVASLADYVEATSNIRLDLWQQDLCSRLDDVINSTGRRVLIHAPPQYGKSIIVSQRLPTFAIAKNPTLRVKLAAFNVSHATNFSEINRDLMHSPEFIEMFPDDGLRVRKNAKGDEWSTRARIALRDAQPSMKALGLISGFVGQGADLLIIDDPYSSPEDAKSKAINQKVWNFWDETARVRLNEKTNVIVMFHRYVENDLAGRLLATGEFELWRYAAIADGDYQCPVTKTKYADPLGRQAGEPLSPRFSAQFLEKQQRSQFVWLSQFQGRPTSAEGDFFKVINFDEKVSAAPANLVRLCRAWDLADSTDGDYTVGVLIGLGKDGNLYVLDVVRKRYLTDERDKLIKSTTLSDAQRYGRRVITRLPQDPGQAGRGQVKHFARLLAGYTLRFYPVTGSKEIRADGFASQVNVGNVKLVEAAWNYDFIEELRTFPRGTYDDQVDAASDAATEVLAGGVGVSV